MINAEFLKKDDIFVGFSVKDHACFADAGYDICCASVSSAVMITANTITEIFGIKADVSVNNDVGEVNLNVTDDENKNADKMIAGLVLHLNEIAKEFPGYIRIEEKNV